MRSHSYICQVHFSAPCNLSCDLLALSCTPRGLRVSVHREQRSSLIGRNGTPASLLSDARCTMVDLSGFDERDQRWYCACNTHCEVHLASAPVLARIVHFCRKAYSLSASSAFSSACSASSAMRLLCSRSPVCALLFQSGGMIKLFSLQASSTS